MAEQPLAHFIEETQYAELDEKTRKLYTYVGFAGGYRLEDRVREYRQQKFAILILLVILLSLSAIGGYAISTDNEPLKVLALCGAIPTLFGLSIQCAIYMIAFAGK
jgi:hypothetical protein